MAFKKIAVLTDVFEMTRANTANVKQRDGEALLTNRIYSLEDALNKNKSYKLTRRWIDIKWKETALLQLEAGNLDWLEYALDEVKFVCQTLKNDIGFAVSDDYREAIGNEGRRGAVPMKKKNDYIAVLEDSIDVIKDIEFKKPVVAQDLSDLKLIIKEESLNLNVLKTDSRDSVVARIEVARSKK